MNGLSEYIDDGPVEDWCAEDGALAAGEGVEPNDDLTELRRVYGDSIATNFSSDAGSGVTIRRPKYSLADGEYVYDADFDRLPRDAGELQAKRVRDPDIVRATVEDALRRCDVSSELVQLALVKRRGAPTKARREARARLREALIGPVEFCSNAEIARILGIPRDTLDYLMTSNSDVRQVVEGRAPGAVASRPISILDPKEKRRDLVRNGPRWNAVEGRPSSLEEDFAGHEYILRFKPLRASERAQSSMSPWTG